jgi:hypothetical protein
MPEWDEMNDALGEIERKMEEECLNGERFCQLHRNRPSAGFITHWTGEPMPCCTDCALYGERKGMTVHRPTITPFELENFTTHRHPTAWVDHSVLDHNHGSCSDHAHWAGGSHETSTPLEVSTSVNDPLGWRVA